MREPLFLVQMSEPATEAEVGGAGFIRYIESKSGQVQAWLQI